MKHLWWNHWSICHSSKHKLLAKKWKIRSHNLFRPSIRISTKSCSLDKTTSRSKLECSTKAKCFVCSVKHEAHTLEYHSSHLFDTDNERLPNSIKHNMKPMEQQMANWANKTFQNNLNKSKFKCFIWFDGINSRFLMSVYCLQILLICFSSLCINMRAADQRLRI